MEGCIFSVINGINHHKLQLQRATHTENTVVSNSCNPSAPRTFHRPRAFCFVYSFLFNQADCTNTACMGEVVFKMSGMHRGCGFGGIGNPQWEQESGNTKLMT